MTIDFHTHVFPDSLAPRAVANVAKIGGIPPHSDGTRAGLRASMARNGIDASVALQIATKPSQNRTVNEWAIQENSPDLVFFGSVHPGGADWPDCVDRLADAGVKGVKFHCDYQGFHVDDDKARPLYERLIERGLVLVFHGGIDIGFPDNVHMTTDRVLRAYESTLRFGTVVLAHMGGWGLWDEVESDLVGSSLYFDTSYTAESLADDQFRRIVAKHGADRILFASDSPWEDQALSLRRVRRIGFAPDVEAAILGGNAQRLLGIRPSPAAPSTAQRRD